MSKEKKQESRRDKKMNVCRIWESLVQRDGDKVRECTLFVTSFPSWAAKQDILLQFSFLSLIRVAFRTLPLMSSQHFHDKALFFAGL